MQIKRLFDPSRDIHRTIEKVITYGASQEARLKAEISEYVVTHSIEEQLHKLLERMQLAMDSGGENEVGVWVSGFYGSGKSSFTKYLGLALDNEFKLGGVPFIKHLQDRLHTPQVKALLTAVAQRFPAAIVMIDLASEMLAGATQAEVSTVLYYKVLQWAGYSRNLKVAALERRLEKDGRYQDFVEKVQAALPGTTWRDLQNDPLVVDALVPKIAHEMYPALFPTATAFSTSTEGFIQFENERVREMIEIVRAKSGKQHIVFIVDEVGQYVAARSNLILNLDGLAKNLKALGAGKVWIIATAQQTLTEDDPRAVINSPELFKLNDRFPIKVDLPSSDIREIVYRRLLAKSPAGETEVGNLFDRYGPALRHHTKLQDAKYYDSDFSRETFVNLYPFLPAHFDILLHLLGALAKSTGGIGLRSAIKVIQDILVEPGPDGSAVADRPVGWLATTVTLYDALERDIKRAFPSVHQAVGTTCLRFHGSRLHEEVAKSVAVLQILGNLPVSIENVASLLHPEVPSPSQLEEIKKAAQEMLADALAPLGEKNGFLCFLSEKLRDVEQERAAVPLRSVDVRRILSEAIRGCFDPLPRTSLHGTFAVTAGLKVVSGSSVTSLAGDQNPIQMMVEFAPSSDYEAARNRLVDESRTRSGQNVIFLVGRTSDTAEDIAGEIYRSQRIAELHRNDPDQEIREYCASQIDSANRAQLELQAKLRQALGHGSFVFRGQTTAASALDPDIADAARRLLAEVAAQVFDRYGEAAERVDTNVAERFLRTTNLSAMTSSLDPLGLVQVTKGVPSIRTDHKAIVSIRDYIDRSGTVDGKKLLEHFSDAPFGWSLDTTRYVLAAMLVGGEIKLRVSGREVTAAGQQALDALKTNKSFGPIGVALRTSKPPIEVVARAAQRLTDLIGEQVLPLEQDLTKAASKHLPQFQHEYGALTEKLAGLGVAGAERARALNQQIADVLLTDASDAPQRFGAEESPLFDNLKWAGEAKKGLDSGLETTLKGLQVLNRELQGLPDTGIPGELRQELAEDMHFVRQRLEKDDFVKHSADLSSALTHGQARVAEAVQRLIERQKLRVNDGLDDLQRLPEWAELTQEERSNGVGQIEALLLSSPPDLGGLRQLLSRDYDIGTALSQLKENVVRQGQERIRKRASEEAPKAEGGRPCVKRTVTVPGNMKTVAELDEVLEEFKEIRQLSHYAEIDITVELKK